MEEKNHKFNSTIDITISSHEELIRTGVLELKIQTDQNREILSTKLRQKELDIKINCDLIKNYYVGDHECLFKSIIKKIREEEDDIKVIDHVISLNSLITMFPRNIDPMVKEIAGEVLSQSKDVNIIKYKQIQLENNLINIIIKVQKETLYGANEEIHSLIDENIHESSDNINKLLTKPSS